MKEAAGMPARCGLSAALLAILACAPCARAAHGPRALEASILRREDADGDHSLDGMDEAPDDNEDFVEEDYPKQRQHTHHAVAVHGKGQLVQNLVQDSPSGRKTDAKSATNAGTGSALIGEERSSFEPRGIPEDGTNITNGTGYPTLVISQDKIQEVMQWETETGKTLTWRHLLGKVLAYLSFEGLIIFLVICFVNKQKYKATQGCATTLCCILFFPCGLCACCFPLDEETPKLPILEQTVAWTPVPIAGGEAEVPSAAPLPPPPTFQGSAEPNVAPLPPPPPVEGGPPAAPDVAPPARDAAPTVPDVAPPAPDAAPPAGEDVSPPESEADGPPEG